jgi:hypothetical protein
MSFELEYINRKSFIDGQLKLYKIEFANTNNDKYLDVMNELSKMNVFLAKTKDVMYNVHRENKALKDELKRLKDL